MPKATLHAALATTKVACNDDRGSSDQEYESLEDTWSCLCAPPQDHRIPSYTVWYSTIPFINGQPNLGTIQRLRMHLRYYIQLMS